MFNNTKLGYTSLFKDYGYYIDKVPTDILNELGIEINNIKSNFKNHKKYNNSLAGEIEHEYEIDISNKHNNIKSYVKGLVDKYDKETNIIEQVYLYYRSRFSLSLSTMWVNFQSKYEYNPMHVHDGILSYVIWYQIPFTFEDELNCRKYTSADNVMYNGKFSFFTNHPNFNGVNRVILDVDKSMEGHAIIFPSNLPHAVYPFYSNDNFRITIAGNINVGKYK